ncbi:hypothetical protein CHH55_14430 [Niallia circulans]|jgi:Protein of unknown function (DUF3021)|uniref:DUF3021 family protein n=1 Tax=Niallia circulans TaxID=1397 RepID=UPI000BA66F25|nr:DUF3021 family protein [Niallia circulans]PAD26468.1 hypothetical protein CHH62_07115 [Niallia circulans]PAD87216.1 hypothetical protein CHH55_14430 [Niallia circulans]
MEWRTKISSGLGTGSFIYLALIYFNGSTMVTTKTVTIVFLISIFVGVSAIIFEVEKISFLLALMAHYTATTLFVCFLYIANYGSQSLVNLIVSISFIYLLTYIVIIVKNKLIVRDLNNHLKKIKRN